MSWTAGSDVADSEVLTSALWNAYLGASGSLNYLKAAVDAPMKAKKDGGSTVGGRQAINFIQGSNVTLTVSDDAGDNEIEVTIAASGSGVTPTQAESSLSGSTYYQTLTSGVSANEKGSWTELIASTAFAVTHIHLMLRPSNNYNYLVDIGIVAATVIIPNIFLPGGTAAPFTHMMFPFSVAISTKILARCQDANGGSTLQIGIITEG